VAGVELGGVPEFIGPFHWSTLMQLLLTQTVAIYDRVHFRCSQHLLPDYLARVRQFSTLWIEYASLHAGLDSLASCLL